MSNASFDLSFRKYHMVSVLVLETIFLVKKPHQACTRVVRGAGKVRKGVTFRILAGKNRKE